MAALDAWYEDAKGWTQEHPEAEQGVELELVDAYAALKRAENGEPEND